MSISDAVKNVMEKIATDGQRNIMQEFVKEKKIEQGQPAGKDSDAYVGGQGEVRRWQQDQPSGKDPEQFDAVEQTIKHPEAIKASELQNARSSATLTPPNAAIPDEIKEAMGLLKIVAVNKAISGEITILHERKPTTLVVGGIESY